MHSVGTWYYNGFDHSLILINEQGTTQIGTPGTSGKLEQPFNPHPADRRGISAAWRERLVVLRSGTVFYFE